MNKNSLLLASFAFLLFVGQVSSQDHLWTFDEDSGTISYDKGTSRNSVNAVLNNAQWRDLSKVGAGAAVHITGADNSFVSFGNGGNNNGGGNNFPNNDDSSDEDDNNDGNRLLPHHNNDDGNNFPNSDNNDDGNNSPNNDNNDDGNNLPNNDNNDDGDNFPNNDDNNGGDDSHHHHHRHGDNGGNNFPAIGQFGTQDFTVAFWFQTTDSSLALADLVGNRAASGHGNFFSVRLSSDGYVSAEVDQDAAGTNYIGFRSVKGGYNDGNWHQVVVTRSGTSLILYIDGSISNSGTGAGVANINNGVVFKIGRSLVASNVARFALDSTFDDLAIYSSAISASQVRTLYLGATNQ